MTVFGFVVLPGVPSAVVAESTIGPFFDLAGGRLEDKHESFRRESRDTCNLAAIIR